MSVRYPAHRFTVTARDPATRARAGVLETPHGAVETPAFVLCATRGALKAATMEEARSLGATLVLGNTYHLMLAPGAEAVGRLGGLARMTGWHGPTLTDSGGFQIFSMGHGGVAAEIKGSRSGTPAPTLIRIDEQGATFRSYLDGSVHQLSPEGSLAAQAAIGADLVVVLDECTPFHATRDYVERALARTMRWSRRSLAAFDAAGGRGSAGPQALIGIAGGHVHEDLRRAAAEFVNGEDFFGHAIGDSLGGTREEMHAIVAFQAPLLRPDRPIHLLGIGQVADIWHGVAHGIDTFDCVHPTRIARHGGALVRAGVEDTGGRDHLNLRNARFRDDPRPIEEGCDCPACSSGLSRAYLHHLLKLDELAALLLITRHNIRFMMRLMAAVRAAIAAGRVREEAAAWGVRLG
ncbi:tRNA guanosine(34) transglycosylase Tgt [Elioraea tepida]|jgi:queuine tRNA-ribosyltransferase|uniref:Queuine tRNA-ribosyltransferase n=1 Tax=Elioraea tepida TaxID=2843330 RepID=A0A975YJ48_9PROT|nr:tRNA guanosine(34) transglycosylase Tgt [Elioraea tepida]QXM24279.1 tRNA guanosine(34) transglycosylase Tgt [Elioraea tepida]